MASGTITGGSMTGTATSRYENKIEWSSTKLNSTQSSVTATLYTRCTSVWDGGAYNGSNDAKASITINGVTKSSSTISISFKNTSAWKAWISNTVTVTHNSDGNKSITISGTYDTNGPAGLKTGSISGSATLDKLLPTLSVSGPNNWSGTIGSTATFTVSVSGGTSYTYQWYFNGSAVGSNSKTYSRQITASDSGKGVYCKITDTSGVSITSRTATITATQNVITVADIPSFIAGYPGDSFSLKAIPSGGSGYTYKWYRGSTQVSTSQIYTSTLIQSWDDQSISCEVSDSSGATATSNECTFRVGLSLGKMEINTKQIQPVKIYNGSKTINAIPFIYTNDELMYCNWNVTYTENNRANIAVAGKAIVG